MIDDDTNARFLLRAVHVVWLHSSRTRAAPEPSSLGEAGFFPLPPQ